MLRPDATIGPYRLIRELGNGTSKSVWLAEKTTPFATMQVALSLPFHPDVEAIRAETTVWLQAGGHPNVLPVIDVDVYDGQIVIVSEYMPDGTLADWLKTLNRLPTVEEVVPLITGVLAGLEHLHGKNVVHRDLKLSNVLLQGDTPRITDFGVSRVVQTAHQEHETNYPAGTINYMSPEVLKGTYSAQSDVWSAGVMLYRMLSGKFPFPKLDEWPHTATIHSILNNDPKPLSTLIPSAVREVVYRSLDKDLSRRYATAKEMRLALIAPTVQQAPVSPRTTVAITEPSGIPDGGLPTSPWNRSLIPNRRINPNDSAEMIYIGPGEFLMGDDDRTNNPRRTVNLPGFWIYRDLITVGKYETYCNAHRKKMPLAPSFNKRWQKKDHPIVNVNWQEARDYCLWVGGDLPTEAQWEKAARRTDGRIYPWGDEWDDGKVWCSKERPGDSGGTTEVGKYGVSPYGCTDMAGNVWQWCRDIYRDLSDISEQGNEVHSGSANNGNIESRVLRGGAWNYTHPVYFRTATRHRDFPVYRNVYRGFRACLPDGH